MARLNEPVVPVESIDALKRRFIRQNREIARANSTQSLRIRNLEAETSRLLSENITLRERNIKLQQEVDSRPQRSTLEGIGNVKDKLEIKLAELSTLVGELGRTHGSAAQNRSPTRKRAERRSPKRSPDQRNWKNALTLSEVTGGQDGRLPPIVEDKYFPRKTLDAEELLGMFDPNNVADSPDLGPPPVAHFDEGDPVKHDNQRRTSTEGISEDVPTEALFPNLETRRKRRESSISREQPRTSLPETSGSLHDTSVSAPSMSAQPLKSGAKRKLSARDEDDGVTIPAPTDKDGFHFNRRTETSVEPVKLVTNHKTNSSHSNSVLEDNSDGSAASAVAKVAHREKPRDAVAAITATRKALGEKTVNTDPVVSPQKPTLNAALASLKKDDLAKPRDRNRDRSRPATETPATKIIRPAPEPKPITTSIPQDPSPTPPVSIPRDTPPPPPLDTGAARPSRRQRGSVSYAEPNLRDKMRRPGKELVDAVSADERVSRAGSVTIESVRAVSEGAKGLEVGEVRIKKEKEEEEEEQEGWEARWKNLPNANDRRSSGVQDGQEKEREKDKEVDNISNLPSSIMTDRRRRVSTLPPSSSSSSTDLHSDLAPSTSATSTTIAALASTSTQRKASSRGQVVDTKPEKDVFAFDGSSPADAAPAPQDPKAGRAARRVSSVPHSLGNEAGRAGEHGERIKSGRRRDTLSVAAAGEKTVGGHMRSGSADMKGDRERSDASLGRAERAAGRRRSMML